jgi:phosphoserine phosphatase
MRQRMTTFLLIRHGETEWNREKVYRGRKDIPLSENGRAQARHLAAALREEKMEAIYASPLSRAMETAAAIAASRSLDIVPCDGLVDMSFGEWEGLSVDEARARDPQAYAIWENDPADFVPPGGESLAAIRSRIAETLGELVQKHPSGTVALVTHRVVCKLMICEVLGLENAAFWKIQQDVCCLNAFTVSNGRYVLVRMNETCHLQASVGAVKLDF